MKASGLFIIFIAIILSVAPLFGTQGSKQDTLLPWIEEHIDQPVDTAPVYRKIMRALHNKGDELSTDMKGKLYSYLGQYHKLYDRLDSAVSYYGQAINIFQTEGDEQVSARLLLKLADVYSLKGDYVQSMKQVYDALDFYEKTKDQQGIAQCYSHICNLLYYEDKYDKSRTYCEMAITIQKQLNIKSDLALSYYNLSCSELFSDLPLDSALLSINRALAIYKQIHEEGYPLMRAMNWRGNVYKYMERFEDARRDYEDVLVKARKSGTEHYIMTSLANMGHIYLIEEKYAEALPYLLEAIKLMEETGDTRNLWENYMHAANSYEHLRNFEKALVYQKKHAEAYEDYLESIIDRMETEAQVKYETRKKEETILSQEEHIAHQNRLQILYISVAALMALFLGGMFYTLRNIRRKRAALAKLNNELDARNHQNELLLKEIHHRVKNNLEMVKSLIALQSAQLTDDASREAMLASQNRVQSMGIIHQKLYQGEKLGSIEMKDYFVNLSEGILDSFDAVGRVQIACVMDELDLDVDTAVPIGLIVNELLTNSMKYAFPDGSPGHINIKLVQQTDQMLTLNVSDDGVGLKKGARAQGTGFGSQLIRLLTQQLNGIMQMDASDGTAVFFEFKVGV